MLLYLDIIPQALITLQTICYKRESLAAHATPAGTTGEGTAHSENVQIVTNSPLPFRTLTQVSPRILEVGTVVIQ
jgi:hypothetical protein